MTTLSLSNIPILTEAVGVPRMAAIEHPFGVTMGAPGDAATQTAVLRAALRALAEIQTPGEVRHLPFTWPKEQRLRTKPTAAPPIAQYLRARPWLFPKFLRRAG